MKLNISKALRKILYIAYAISIIQIVVATLALLFLQPEIPLFYTLAEEEQQLAPKIWVLIFPILSVAINLAHSFILGINTKKDEVLLSLFVKITIILQVVLLLALLRIIYIVT